jgi:ribulose-phosphate 3-epimerase
MKITVSYINSLYDSKKTVDLINETSADAIHVDLIDGIYAGTKNFDINHLPEIFKDNRKPIDIHMMVNRPSGYLNDLLKLKPICIYIHPSTEPSAFGLLNELNNYGIKRGLVINPDEKIPSFSHYFPYVDRVLLMSVTPGKGGQKFLDNTKDRLQELISFKKDNDFEIYVDGGINDETIKEVLNADGIISGSFICMNKDFENQIMKLKNSITQ